MENAPSPYFVKAEDSYQVKVKAMYLKLKDGKYQETGDPDDLLPFAEPNRPLPADNNSRDKGNGFKNTRQSPVVFLTTTGMAADLPDGRAGAVIGEVFCDTRANCFRVTRTD